MRTALPLLCFGLALPGCSSNPDASEADAGAPADAYEPNPGPPGCGLPAAAFCDPFDAPTAGGGREGELDPKKWSVTRASQGGLGAGFTSIAPYALPIGTATIPACRANLPARVLPDQDILICDPTSTIDSRSLLVAAAEQNYGQVGVRIRRPFDFAGRTGKIVFDATLQPSGLLGWVAVSVTEDPIGAPSYLRVQNEENGPIPRNALEIHFNQNCQVTDQVSVSSIVVIRGYTHQFIEVPGNERHCVGIKPGQLNHVEIELSADHVAISASPASADGVTFAPVERLAEHDISLPFTRGYVHLDVYNHASEKYSDNHSTDSLVARFDTVGFDGPMLPVETGAEVPDSLTPVPVPSGSVFTGAVNVGYRLGDLTRDGFTAPLSFTAIDVAGATRAQLALIWWSLMPSATGQGDPADYTLHYRINGGPTHAYQYPPPQLAFIAAQAAAQQPMAGSAAVRIDVDPAELVSGTNTIEFATANVPTSYPPLVSNIDLLVSRP